MYKEMKGLIAPQLTPINNDGSVNYDEYKKLTTFLCNNGVDGIFVCGTTGEFVNYTVDEKCKSLESAKAGCKDDTALMFNATAMNIPDIKHLCKVAKETGADAISFTSPYYHAYDKTALIDYFCKCLDFADGMPVYLYNMPGMTKNPITPEIIKSVYAKCPNLKGIKDSSMDFMTYLDFQKERPFDEFAVITGNDAQVLTSLQAGGDSVVVAMAGVFPQICKSIFTKYFAGDIEGARKAQDTIMDLRALARSIMPVMSHKEMLTYLGFNMGPAHFPMRNLTASEKEKVKAKLVELQLI